MRSSSIKSESSLWLYIRDGMLGRRDATRHEDRLSGGTPDVSYGMAGNNGWIELKWLNVVVADKYAPIKIPHFTYDQKRFLRKRGAAGGHCWLLIGVEDVNGQPTFLLINWTEVDDTIGDTASYDDLYGKCVRAWGDMIDFDQLREFLRRGG